MLPVAHSCSLREQNAASGRWTGDIQAAIFCLAQKSFQLLFHKR